MSATFISLICITLTKLKKYANKIENESGGKHLDCFKSNGTVENIKLQLKIVHTKSVLFLSDIKREIIFKDKDEQ